jgi:hypothetical protein
MIRTILACLVTLLLTSSASSAPKPAPAAAAAAVTSVTYDLSDLINPARPDDQPDPTPARLAADAPIGGIHSSRSESRKSLVAVIRESVDPQSWDPQGPARLTLDGNRFVIAQTAYNHRMIVKMLRQLRESDQPGAKLLSRFNAALRLPDGTRFERARLADAVAAVAKLVKIPVEINYKSLLKVGIAFDTPVTADISLQTPAHAIRTLFRSAAAGNVDLPVAFDATAKTVTLSLDARTWAALSDPVASRQTVSRAYDIRDLPARAAGLDPATAHPRQEVIDALVDRIRKEFDPISVSEKYGLLIVTAPRATAEEFVQYLDDLDAQAVAKPKAP